MRASDIVLAVIGEHWLTIDDEHGKRRLDQPQDFVRKELEYSIQRKMAIIPILIDSASMPHSDELPESLRVLATLQAAHLRDSDFRYDFERLFGVIKQYEERKRENITLSAPESPNDKITGEHLALIYSCWRAPQYDERWRGQEVYRFDIIVEASPAVLDSIEKVVYLLPPAWASFFITKRSPGSSIGVWSKRTDLGRTRRSTGAAGRAFSIFQGFWPPPGYLNR